MQVGEKMANIRYISTDGKDLELITPLREKTRQFHTERSIHFKKRITEISIQDTNKQILVQSSGGILLDLVEDLDVKELIGYCLTGINSNMNGEIFSIFIKPDYRRLGIGDKLIKQALTWMDKWGVKRKTLHIWAGNEEVIDFYRRYNFEVRSIIMEQVE
jgi:diamine N-acetyltransferase